jgi:hypothetical protein
MNRLDEAFDRAADRLRQLAEELAAEGGVKAKLAEPLAEDAAFLRKLKPSLVAARMRGEAPTDQEPATVMISPGGPQLGRRPKPKREAAERKSPLGGQNPFVVVGAAFALGIMFAKIVDWRSHAHPRV